MNIHRISSVFKGSIPGFHKNIILIHSHNNFHYCCENSNVVALSHGGVSIKVLSDRFHCGFLTHMNHCASFVLRSHLLSLMFLLPLPSCWSTPLPEHVL